MAMSAALHPVGQLEDRRVEVNGLSIFMRVADDQPVPTPEPVILVPGLNVSSRHTALLGTLLAPHAHVYALDLPGYGHSDKPRRYYSLRDRSDFLADWMRTTGLERAVVFGSSYSAQIVSDFAVRHARYVSRLILASPTIDPSSRPLPRLVYRWRVNEHREPPNVGAATKADYRDVSKSRAVFTLWQMVRDHIEDRLSDIQAPTLVIRGGKDPIVSPQWAEEIVRHIPNARLVTIPGGSHALTLDATEQLAHALLPFLRDQLPDPADLVIGSQLSSPPYVADFDSASAMLKATAQSLRGESFRQVGNTIPLGPLTGSVAWTIDALPRVLRERIYITSGVLEATKPARIASVHAEDISRWVVSQYAARTYPAAAIGSSNGALTHLYAAMGIPWLPQTVLLPVKARLPVDDPRRALAALRETGQALLDANPELELHHMRDPSQDRLMLRGMSYFRVKRRRLGHTYERFLENTLEPGATLFVVECRQSWPATQTGERQFFQFGAVGGATAEEYLRGGRRVADFLRREGSPYRYWSAPPADSVQPEAEWGFAPELLDDIERLARRRGYRLRRITFDHPMDTSPLVADLYRWWYAEHQRPSNRLLVDSFVLMDPHWTLRSRSVPFWMTFNTRPDADALERYLTDASPFDEIFLMLFSHGVNSIGLAGIARWRTILERARRHGAFVGVDTHTYPRDFATFIRYASDLQRKLPADGPLPEPLTSDELDAFLSEHGGRYAVQWI